MLVNEHREAYKEAMRRIYAPFVNEDTCCAICSAKIVGNEFEAFIASSIAVNAENFYGCLCPPCYDEFMIIPDGSLKGHARTFLPYEEFLRGKELKNEVETKQPEEE